ncbi:hypothetical protein [Arcanobacterium ihumii]|uniref:hypothetical protein n=1 Tax=Arcanobacterium ihumii TaxID=2138162 RepID=UPI000F545F3E|nr:hypothetical protein [Arcanobacterium ihumii]
MPRTVVSLRIESTLKEFSIKQIAGIVLAIAGILIAVVTIVTTIFRDSDSVVSLTVPASHDSTLVFTSPGVLNLGNEKVSIDIEAPDETIVWGIGNSNDVKAYVGNSTAIEVEGFETWDKAKLKNHEGKPEAIASDKDRAAKGEFDISQSDLWVESGKSEGKAHVDFSLPQGLDRSLVVSTLSGKTPKVTLSWSGAQSSSSPIPWVFIGVLVALVGGFLLLGDSQDRARLKELRERQIRRREQKQKFAEAQTSILPAFKGDIASPETDRELQIRHTDRALGAIIIPGTLRSQTLRSRELNSQDRVLLKVVELEEQEDKELIDSLPGSAGATLLKSGEVEGNTIEGASEESAESVEDKKDEYWKSLWTFAHRTDGNESGSKNA